MDTKLFGSDAIRARAPCSTAVPAIQHLAGALSFLFAVHTLLQKLVPGFMA